MHARSVFKAVRTQQPTVGIPLPRPAVPEPVAIFGFFRQLSIAMPRSLHAMQFAFKQTLLVPQNPFAIKGAPQRDFGLVLIWSNVVADYNT